jgi:hypothetical protein
MATYTVTRNHWCVVIDHGFAGNPFRFTARDACTWNYPQGVLVSAATAREAREVLAIEPVSLDWTVKPRERQIVPIAREG